ncbi:MAG: hypothetical protein M1830_009003 [Pleopsidium flavum]|nr:MAG: hypothetical protein M1830_009003 [Pleopsidium flavum]
MYHSGEGPFILVAIAIKDWIYIDGGEISLIKGVVEPCECGELLANYFKRLMELDIANTTIAIDLSTDWTNTSLTFVTTPRPAASLAENYQTLWWSKRDSSIYCFGGEVSFAGDGADRVTPQNSIWMFSPNDQGGGDWQAALGHTSDRPFPPNITRPASGASAASSENGYYLGGYASFGTDPNVNLPLNVKQPLPGLLSFDFETSMWNNTSDGGFTASSALINARPPSGAMQFVPAFGVDGILLVMGGASSQRTNPFNNITTYDIHGQAWHSQLATGDIPDPRDHFCAVGVQSNENNTYEIFMHGGMIKGHPGSGSTGSDQVYILSLPAFRWFQANYSSAYPRAYHTCHAARDSQMIIIGGLNPTQYQDKFQDLWSGNMATADPWTLGIGVFDMKNLAWKDSYDARAVVYESPDKVKQYYLKYTTGLLTPFFLQNTPSSWSSPEVQQTFTNTTTARGPVSNPKLRRISVVAQQRA